MANYEMTDREILEELLAEKRMRDRWRRVKLCIAAIVVILIIVAASIIVPKIISAYRTYQDTMARINTVVDQVESTMDQVQSSFDELDSSIAEIRSTVESTVNDLKDQFAGLSELTETLEGLKGFNLFRR